MSTVRFVAGKGSEAPKAPGGRIALREALTAPRPIPRTKMQVIFPAVMGVAFLGMLALMFSQPALRSGPVGYFSLFFPFMMLMSFGGMLTMGRYGGGDKQLTPAQMEAARRDYLMALDEKRDEVSAAAEAQFAQFAWFHPEPGLLRGLVGSARMWERGRGHPHFGWVRIGVGKTELAMKFETPLMGRSEDYEPITYEALSAFLLEQSAVRGIAKPLSMTTVAGWALIGEAGMEPVYALARAMICQAALFHSPSDLKIMVVTDDPARWDWVKWLPHTERAAGPDTVDPPRMVWTSAEDMDATVGLELHQERKGFGQADGAVSPHWLVFNDQGRVGAEWETLTRKAGVAGVTFLRLVSEPGTGVGFSPETTLFVTSKEIRDRHGKVAVPDQLEESSARAIGRKMARYRPQGQSGAAATTTRPDMIDLFEILGIPNAAEIDVDRTWAATRSGPPFEDNAWGGEWLKITIGAEDGGAPMVLDFKETHEGGMGHHMILVGTTGSGKSSLLTTLILSAALTHSPETLNIAFFDWKGSTTAHAIAGLPHVVAAMNNLRNDSLWVERMGDVIYGELERRKRMLDRARVSDAAEYEYLRIHRGERLEPMPALLVIIDEFTQMFVEHPPAKAIIDEIGRQGRALHVKMIMGSQRLGHEMQTGVMGNIPIRVALRTLDDVDSRAVIGTDEAKYLPLKPAGAGYLRVSGRPRMTRFQTAYVQKNYTPPRHAEAAAVRAQVGYVPPREFAASGMEPLALPAVSAVPVVAQAETVTGPDGRPLRQIQAATESLRYRYIRPVHRMWLPPLEPLPVDELVRRLRRRPWHDGYGDNKGLRFPVGVEDRPFQHAQRVYAVDVAGGNCAVIGMQGAGKTTALATMITGAALMYTPARIQFYVIALGGPQLNEVEGLPQVGSLARTAESERVGRTIAEMTTLIDERERAFSELKLTVEEFRQRKFGGVSGPVPDDPFGDVFVVIDGWAQFSQGGFDRYVGDVEAILRRGPAYGVHAIISASGWISGKLTSGMTPELGTNVELRLAENDDLHRNSMAVAKKVPYGDKEVLGEDDDFGDDEPAVRGEDKETTKLRVRGRGTSMAGYHFQTALPSLTVGGQVVGVREAAAVVASVAGVSGSAAEVRILPSQVPLGEVWDQWLRRGGGTPGQVPFGISEVGLLPAVADFAAAPHFLVTGNPECGKSNALAALAQAVMRAYRPDEARIYVVDPHNSLLQVVEGAHLGGYVYRERQVRDMAAEVARVLETRLPPDHATQAELAAGVRWSGPQIFVVVDNEETIQSWDSGMSFAPGAAGYPLEPLLGFLDRGREVGLHLLVSRRIGNWGRAVASPLVGRMLQLNVPGVVMDGPRAQGEIMGGVTASTQPAGRGIYVTDKLAAPVQIAVAAGR
ncbi:MAG TPA: type VII secretion protein EccCa [Mycobacterium sp.]|nr:type VII secretion protein EccCa [Mycobacterium sp.]